MLAIFALWLSLDLSVPDNQTAFHENTTKPKGRRKIFYSHNLEKWMIQEIILFHNDREQQKIKTTKNKHQSSFPFWLFTLKLVEHNQDEV